MSKIKEVIIKESPSIFFEEFFKISYLDLSLKDKKKKIPLWEVS